MQGFFSGHRPLATGTFLCLFVASLLAPLSTEAASSSASVGATFILRPHCDSTDFRAAFAVTNTVTAAVSDSACPDFAVKDPQTRQTQSLKEGDPLDMDLILVNPSAQPITRFRAWIAYDPTVIEGELLDVATAFPTPTPGEKDFSVSDGMIKVSGSADTPQTGTHLIVAHIRLHALPTTQTSVPMTFYDVTGTVSSHTAIIIKNGTTETNIASDVPGTLLVQMTPSPTTSVTVSSSMTASGAVSSASSSALTASSAQSVAASTAASSIPLAQPAPTPSVFNLLQVQHLKLTTEGSSVFLAWDTLPSADLVGYNLYYGTISGKYLQKRSVDKNSTTMTIRALPEGVTYYFAVRGVNAQNTETDFSQEVGISVGNPKTSTAPLSASALTQAPQTPQTSGTVSGTTGPSSSLLLFLLVSAVAGTALAFRRQLSAKPTV